MLVIQRYYTIYNYRTDPLKKHSCLVAQELHMYTNSHSPRNNLKLMSIFTHKDLHLGNFKAAIFEISNNREIA